MSASSRDPSRPRRTYACFFDWPQKLTKEYGIVRAFNEALAAAHEPLFRSFVVNDPDPPDIAAVDAQDRRTGIEITELVSRKAIQANLRDRAIYRDWQHTEVIGEIAKIIRSKDERCRKVTEFDRLVLLIHTDEPSIDYEDLRRMLENHRFEMPQSFDEVVLLFSYDPRFEKYPYIRLALAKPDSVTEHPPDRTP